MMSMNSPLASLLAAAGLALAGMAAQANTVLSTPSLSGDVSITGFADGSPQTFAVSYSRLAGSINLLALPDGNYDVAARGTFSFTGSSAPGGSVTVNLPVPTPIYSGFLGSSGLTPGAYSYSFGTPIGVDVPFNFTLNYNGNVSPQMLALLQGLGLPFTNPDGAGSLAVTGTFLANGTAANFSFAESNLTWTGFGRTLALLDSSQGGGNGVIDGPFAMTNVQITAVPEPSTLLAFALGGLLVLRQVRSAKR
jgi:hypothetical protein